MRMFHHRPRTGTTIAGHRVIVVTGVAPDQALA